MDYLPPQQLKLFSGPPEEDTRQQSRSTAASAVSLPPFSRAASLTSSVNSLGLVAFVDPQLQQQPFAAAAATAAATATAAAAATDDRVTLQHTTSEKFACILGNPLKGPPWMGSLGGPLGAPNPKEEEGDLALLMRHKSCPSLDAPIQSSRSNSSSSNSSSSSGGSTPCSGLAAASEAAAPSPLGPFSPQSRLRAEDLGLQHLQQQQQQQHQQQTSLQQTSLQQQQRQQLQQQPPVSCIATEGCSGEVVYVEFVSEASTRGLQLLMRARRGGGNAGLLGLAAAAFEGQQQPPAAAAVGAAAAAAAAAQHSNAIVVQQLKPLLQHCPIFNAARDRGLQDKTSSTSSSSSGDSPCCWVVGWEELLSGFFPAWRSLSSVSVSSSFVSHRTFLSPQFLSPGRSP
ncbi:hypothetical protein ACSSS7_000836 [Eimeria intestinalis]